MEGWRGRQIKKTTSWVVWDWTEQARCHRTRQKTKVISGTVSITQILDLSLTTLLLIDTGFSCYETITLNFNRAIRLVQII